MEPLITSKDTDLGQIPALLMLGDRAGYWKRGNINLDFGGGRLDKFSVALEERGVVNLVVDPYNRTESHNMTSMMHVAAEGGADTCTVSNVLNVIPDDAAIRRLLVDVHYMLKKNGWAYFTVYNGDGTGIAHPTAKGWQRNDLLSNYVHFVTELFGDSNVEIHRRVIEARKVTKWEGHEE